MTPQEIKETRVKLGRSQTEFGALIKRGRRTVWRLESGQTRPKGVVLVQLKKLKTVADRLGA